jgi:hypothetical protein
MPFFGNPPNGQLQKKALINQKVTNYFGFNLPIFSPFSHFANFNLPTCALKLVGVLGD